MIYSHSFHNHFGVKINLGCRLLTADRKKEFLANGIVPESEKELTIEEAYPIVLDRYEDNYLQDENVAYYSSPYTYPDFYPYFTLVPMTFAWFYMYDHYLYED